MKKITMIKAQKHKGLFILYLNGRYAFPVSENVLIKYRLFKGMPVDSVLQAKLTSADSKSKLLGTAIDFLSHHLRTKREIQKKLRKRTSDSGMIEAVIHKLQVMNLVNDSEYAASYIRTEVRKRNKGPLRIRARLVQLGITESIISQMIDKYYPESLRLKNGHHQAEKLFHKSNRDSFTFKINRLKRQLVRKGYSFDDVSQIISRADFHPDLNQQRQLLKQKADLAWQRYRRYDLVPRKMKTKQYLYRKGFSIDAIDDALDNIIN